MVNHRTSSSNERVWVSLWTGLLTKHVLFNDVNTLKCCRNFAPVGVGTCMEDYLNLVGVCNEY